MNVFIKLIPNAKQNEITEDVFDNDGKRFLKIKVNQPSENGKAHKAAIDLLEKYLKVKKGAVSIISGETSLDKIVEIKWD